MHISVAALRAAVRNFVPQSIHCLREGYTLRTLRSDLLAGISVGVIAFPLAIAYAIGAGLSPERGIFTAIVGGFLIALLGGSRVQIGGPTSTMIIALIGIIARHGLEGMAITTLLAGVLLLIFGLMGIGSYFKHVPYPVVMGLTTGIALVIFTSQIKDFFGLSIDSTPSNFLDRWGAYFTHAHSWNRQAFLVGVIALSIMMYLRRYKPAFPGALVALLCTTSLVYFFNIDVETIGEHFDLLPRTLPHPSFPHITFDTLLTLLPDALTIATLSAIESLLSATVSEGMTGWRYQSNCELMAQGVANIGSAIFGGIPLAGALSRTAVNVKAGAQTPLAGMIHALAVFTIMFFFAPLTTHIPLSALSAILLMISWNMCELHRFFHFFTAPRRDVIVLVTVFGLTVLTNITIAVQIGMILAAFLFMHQLSKEKE